MKLSIARLRAAALVLAAAPMLAACEGMLTEDPVIIASGPAGGGIFTSYASIGTSISAGIQSGGINDSTQRDAFTYQLAQAMGLTPGVNWFYPALRMPGCPAPFTNPLTGQRVGGASATGCAFRDAASIAPVTHNVGIPFLRAQQASDVTVVPFPTDTLKLQQFLTGGLAPVTAAKRANPTFITVEVGANDVLHAATQGNVALLTDATVFTNAINAIAESLATISPAPAVAMSNIPNVTTIPFLTRASVLFCLKNGPAVCGPTSPPATLPFSAPTFTITASCAPNAGGGIGDGYLVSFPALGAMVASVTAGLSAKIDCLNDSALVGTAASPLVPVAPAGPTTNPTELAAIQARVTALNGAIQTLATARGYALVDINTALAAIPGCTAPGQANCIPPVPNFANPTPGNLFGTLFSLDGVHPTRAGHRLLAQAFAAQINTTFGTSITVP